MLWRKLFPRRVVLIINGNLLTAKVWAEIRKVPIRKLKEEIASGYVVCESTERHLAKIEKWAKEPSQSKMVEPPGKLLLYRILE